jgi:hypothetical protein
MDKFRKNEFCVRHWRWTPCLCKSDYKDDCIPYISEEGAKMLAQYHSGYVSRREMEEYAKTLMDDNFEVQWTNGVA